jgi:formylmethanofuran dehydrogenase subunit E
MDMKDWETAVAFHGHACPGLAIGVRACDAARAEIGASRAADEELVCVTENDACGVDAIQALLGCTFGKGNLVFRDTGKHAFTFIRRGAADGLRVCYRARPEGGREDVLRYILEAPVGELFAIRRIAVQPPDMARRYPSAVCEACGEITGEHRIRLRDGRKLCLDCYDGRRAGNLSGPPTGFVDCGGRGFRP